MEPYVLPILLFILCAAVLSVGLLLVPRMLAPRRTTEVKQMPYESGVDPFHDSRRRFDVRFHLVAIVFLIFDVELLFLYPWAVASKPLEGGIAAAVHDQWVESRSLAFGGVLVFLALLVLGIIYDWRKGVFRWR